MTAHEKIRHKFTVDERNYEAVGFLRAGESRIYGEEIFLRTANQNGGAIGDEEYAYLAERMVKFPPSLVGCVLVTNRRPKPDERLSPDAERKRDKQVLCFGFNQGRWQRSWGCACPICEWKPNELVIRRCL